MSQPNFNIGNQQAVPGSEYDNLSNEELAKLINAAQRLKGKPANMRPAQPPPPPPTIRDYSRLPGFENVNIPVRG